MGPFRHHKATSVLHVLRCISQKARGAFSCMNRSLIRPILQPRHLYEAQLQRPCNQGRFKTVNRNAMCVLA